MTFEHTDTAHALDGEHIAIKESPFGHVCCDCGLGHWVEYCLVDEDAQPIAWPEGAILVMAWKRAEDLTAEHRGDR